MGNAKPYFYGTGRMLGRVSRLYGKFARSESKPQMRQSRKSLKHHSYVSAFWAGYSFLVASISSLFVSGFSSLPLTKWDDKGGIPQADVVLVSVLDLLWISVAVSIERAPRRCEVRCSELRTSRKLTTSETSANCSSTTC